MILVIKYKCYEEQSSIAMRLKLNLLTDKFFTARVAVICVKARAMVRGYGKKKRDCFAFNEKKLTS